MFGTKSTTLNLHRIKLYIHHANFSVRLKMFQLIEIIIKLFPSHINSATNHSANFEVVMIKHFIDANHHFDIDLAMLETQFHYSRSFISHRFKTFYDVSTMKYYNQKQMETTYGFPPKDVKRQSNVVLDEKERKFIH